MSEAQVEGRNN